MHFKFPALVAMCLSLTTKAENQDCYEGGVDWATLGGNNNISNAFWRICDRISARTHKIGETISDCENVGDHRVDISIKISKDPDAVDGSIELNQNHCHGYLSQVQSECSHGGHIYVVRSSTGKKEAKASVMADPQWAQC